MQSRIRAFDGSLADAEGLLAVERATFDESPYSAAQVRAMLTDGPQSAWLALAEGNVVGFVVAFPTSGLRGVCWEMDLLAVHSRWTGHGLATRLIQAAAAHGAGVARRARAVVATDNLASVRAFRRAGFQTMPETCRLLIYRTDRLSSRPVTTPGVAIREADSIADAANWLADPLPAHDDPNLILLLAEQGGQPAGYAELIEVQTLLYHGVWIESLVASAQAVRKALVQQALTQARIAALDEVGAMVPQSNWPLQQVLVAAGFRSLGDFHWLTAELPPPDLAEQGHG